MGRRGHISQGIVLDKLAYGWSPEGIGPKYRLSKLFALCAEAIRRIGPAITLVVPGFVARKVVEGELLTIGNEGFQVLDFALH
jgi:hypothetical protein